MSNRLFLFVAFIALIASSAAAQSFEPGTNVITAGLGIGGNYGAYDTYTAQTPAIGIAYEKATSIEVGPGVLGLGGYLGYKSLAAKDKTPYYNYDYRWNYTILGFRGAYHWNEWHKVPKLDTYGGLMLAYNIVNFQDKTDYPDGYDYTGSSSSGLGLSMYFGGRYYLGENVGAFAELGFGISYLTLGACFKF